MMRFWVWLGVFVLVVLPGSVAATTTADFTIRQQIGVDITPPTVPANLTAAAISTSQINVAWDVATDDYQVDGYQLFRDGVQIATTTLLTYNDTSLSPSTTYAYTVRAFDVAGNVSSSTAPVSTTTLALPEPPPEEDSTTQPSYATPRLRSIDIEPTEYTAELTWRTLTQARYILEWGKTEEYELGAVQNEVARLQHQTLIAGLEPGTQYSFSIIAIDGFGRQHEILTDTFTTIALPDNEAPPNPTDFTAAVADRAVNLTWRNPSVDDFARVRVVRSPFFYPQRPDDGYLLYEGVASQFSDQAAFRYDEVQYYTIFAYDENGNRSSGAGVRAVYQAATQQSADNSQAVLLPPEPSEVSTTTIDQSQVIDLRFSDLIFMQGGVDVPVRQGVVEVSSNAPLTVRLNNELVTSSLGSALLVLDEQAGVRSSTYLLQVNRQQTAYEAVLSAIAPGTYAVTLVLYGLDDRVLGLVSGELVSASDVPYVVNQPVPGWLAQLQESGVVLIGLLIIVLSLFLLWWRRSSEEQESIGG